MARFDFLLTGLYRMARQTMIAGMVAALGPEAAEAAEERGDIPPDVTESGGAEWVADLLQLHHNELEHIERLQDEILAARQNR